MRPLTLFVLLLAVLPALAYNVTQSERCLFYAYSSYCPYDQLDAWNCKYCTPATPELPRNLSFTFNNDTDTFAFTGYDAINNQIVVTFRGTVKTDIKNWITDLQLGKSQAWELPGCMVHTGFLTAYQGMQADVEAMVNFLITQYPSASLLFTGHSLGGALAVLSAAHFTAPSRVLLGTNLVKPILMYTFGLPRVGNDVFASWFDKLPTVTHWRVTNMRDVVPHLPAKIMGYRHSLREVFYTSYQDYTLCSDNDSEDMSCSDQYFFPDSIPDHEMYLGYHREC